MRRARPLAEQVIVITGASSGIGLLTARKAAAAGAKVMLVARGEPALAAAVAAIRAEGGTADYAIADVAVAEQVEAAAASAVATFGRIDSWINNAGVAIYASLAETPLDEHRRLFDTNYFGMVNGTQAALSHLRESKGTLITIGSIACELSSPLLGAYTASKHALKGYVDSLRIELEAEDAPVALCLVKPSGIDTPIGQHAANHEGHEARIPPPVYDPEIVADALLDMAYRPRREITIGGFGRLNVLVGTHFPRLLDRVGGWMIPLLIDPERPPTPGNALFTAGDGGRVRSGIERGRSFSLYTTLARHRGAVGLGLLVAAMVVTARRGGRKALTA